MSFDWYKFLDQHGIEYRERGPSTSKDNLYVRCPFCGPADQGAHMGISILNKGWGCWRNQGHRGRRPERLIQALINCSWLEAARLAGTGGGGPQIGNGSLLGAVTAALGLSPEVKAEHKLDMPREFKEMRLALPNSWNPVVWYLADRGYGSLDIDFLSRRFNIRSCLSGDWSYRLIVPVYDHLTELVTWTGRAVNPDAKVRYKTLTSDPDKAGDGPLARGPITDYLLGMPDLMKGGSFLVLTEGFFDAARLQLYVDYLDARASCLWGKVASDAQLDLIAQLAPLYQRVLLLLDPDASLDALSVGRMMQALGVRTLTLDGNDDPDEMREKDLWKLVDKMEALVV